MAITFTWSVQPNGLRVKEVNGNADTIVHVTYKVQASDGADSVELINNTELQPSAEAPFIPFEQLTEAQVIDWVKSVIPAKQKTHFEEMLTRRLAIKKNPPVMPVAKAAPWQTCVQG